MAHNPGLLELSEAELVRLWEEQRLPPAALVTTTGLPLRVVYRGRRNRGPGPDFRDAVIATADGRLRQGDVEVHRRSSDLWRHGHQGDDAYRRLVLHLVFHDDGPAVVATGGEPVAVVALAPWVQQRAVAIERWLEGPAPWQEPCRSAVMRLGAAEVARRLEEGGWLRLAGKIAAFGRGIERDGAAVALGRGLAEAVGYGSQRPVFHRLAQHLPWPQIWKVVRRGDVITLEALLLGSAGLLPGQQGAAPAVPYAMLLEERWAGLGLPSRPGATCRGWAPARPANSPARRLVGLAHLLLRFREQGLTKGLLPVVAGAATPRALLSQLTVRSEGFWRSHHDLCRPPGRLPPSLIGPGRAAELALNVVLPWAAAWAIKAGDKALTERVQGLLRRLPRPSSYGLTRHLEQAVRGAISASALHQQGMLHLYRQHCSQGGCGRCPLS